jgi:hypothetical protein
MSRRRRFDADGKRGKLVQSQQQLDADKHEPYTYLETIGYREPECGEAADTKNYQLQAYRTPSAASSSACMPASISRKIASSAVAVPKAAVVGQCIIATNKMAHKPIAAM